MTVAVANLEYANTFGHWVVRTNELAHAMSTKVLTADSNTTVGNVGLNGTFTANTLSTDVITGTTITFNAANNVISGNSRLSTVGMFNVKGDMLLDAVSKLQIPGANATHRYLCVNNSTGNAFFNNIVLALSGLSDVDTTNAALSNTSILMYNSGTGKWQTNTITLIDSTRINTLNVGSISSAFTVAGNTTWTGTMFVNTTNGRVGIGAMLNPAATLHVNGAIYATGDVTSFYTSDSRLKENIFTVNTKDALLKVSRLRPVTFNWRKDLSELTKYAAPDLDGKPKTGLLAQEVQQIFPQHTYTRDDGFLSVDYVALIPELIASVIELRERIRILEDAKK